MPEISRFFGIVIKMFFDDHNPPHFHAEYGGDRRDIETVRFSGKWVRSLKSVRGKVARLGFAHPLIGARDGDTRREASLALHLSRAGSRRSCGITVRASARPAPPQLAAYAQTDRLRMIIIINLFLAIWFCATLILGAREAKAETVTVLLVIDGGTCLLDDGRLVRYLGIDAPEKGDPQSEEATLANNELVGGKEIELAPGSPEQDRDGRLLAHVFVDDAFVNEELVLQGYAHRRRPISAKYKDRLLKAQEEARAANRGIWAKAGAGHIAISRVYADISFQTLFSYQIPRWSCGPA